MDNKQGCWKDGTCYLQKDGKCTKVTKGYCIHDEPGFLLVGNYLGDDE